VDGLNITPSDSPMPTCEACIQAKQVHAPFPRHAERRAQNTGELTHTDLWEARTIGHNGAKYFLSFVDDHSRCVAIEFLKTKDQTTSKVKSYVAYLERQYGMQPKAFRANNGGNM